MHCREGGLTYKGRLDINLEVDIDGENIPDSTRYLGDLPIMVRSNRCNIEGLSPSELIARGEEPTEFGGYFVIRGAEKIVRLLIGTKRNYPLCIARPRWKTRAANFTEYGVLIRCVRGYHRSSTIVMHYLSSCAIVLNFMYRKQLLFLPITVLLKALCKYSDKTIYEALMRGRNDDELLKETVKNMMGRLNHLKLVTQQDALAYIGSSFRVLFTHIPAWYSDVAVGQYLLQQCILIHLDNGEDKFNMLVYMAHKLS